MLFTLGQFEYQRNVRGDLPSFFPFIFFPTQQRESSQFFDLQYSKTKKKYRDEDTGEYVKGLLMKFCLNRGEDIPTLTNDECLRWITGYQLDPLSTAIKARCSQELRDYFTGYLFGLIVLFCDGYLRLSSKKPILAGYSPSTYSRFFKMMKRVPSEIHMIICNRAFGNPSNLIPFHIRKDFVYLYHLFVTFKSL